VRQTVQEKGLPAFEDSAGLPCNLTIGGLQVVLWPRREDSSSFDPNITLPDQRGVGVCLEAGYALSGATHARVKLWRPDRPKVPSLIVWGSNSPEGEVVTGVEVGGEQLTGLGDQQDAFRYVNSALFRAADAGGIAVVQ
jgi:hypothetical protein